MKMNVGDYVKTKKRGFREPQIAKIKKMEKWKKKEINSSRRIKTKKICFFIGVFIASLLFFTLVHHYNDF